MANKNNKKRKQMETETECSQSWLSEISTDNF